MDSSNIPVAICEKTKTEISEVYGNFNKILQAYLKF